MNTIPPEPEKPLPSDCCGGGACCPCVWDYYYEKLAEWREAKRAIETQTAVTEDSAAQKPG
jgi:hypothetical protein